MKKHFYIVLVWLSFKTFAQSYYFDSTIIGKYHGIIYEHDLADSTIYTICYNDTMIMDEGTFPSGNYLASSDKCKGSYYSDFVKYFIDTSFIRMPASCQCFNGKYFGFNDSLRLKYFWLPTFNDRFFRFLGKKYWSPVTGWTGVKNNKKEEVVFDVFPNPSVSKVSLVFENGYLPKNRKGIITDINGKTVMDFEISSIDASSIINTAGLAAGVYIVRIEDHERAFIKRLVIAK